MSVLKCLLGCPHPHPLALMDAVCAHGDLRIPSGSAEDRCQVTRAAGASQAVAGTMGLGGGWGQKAASRMLLSCGTGACWVCFGAQGRGQPS